MSPHQDRVHVCFIKACPPKNGERQRRDNCAFKEFAHMETWTHTFEEYDIEPQMKHTNTHKETSKNSDTHTKG